MAKDEKVSAEQVVRDIRRETRRKYSAQEKIRIVLKGCAVRTASRSCVAAKASTRTCITSGAKNSWKQARRG